MSAILTHVRTTDSVKIHQAAITVCAQTDSWE